MLGYIKMYRQLLDNEIYFDGKFDKTHAWLDLLYLANFNDSIIVKRGIRVNVKRGQIAKSIDFFCDRWQWSHPTVEKFLNYLEDCGQICIQRSKLINLISVINYDKFQSNLENDCEQNCIQTCEQTRKVSPTPLSKESRKKKEENIITPLPPKGGVPPQKTDDVEEVIFEMVEEKPKYNHPQPPQELDATAIPRFNAFYDSLVPFVERYGKEMIREFFEYWTEPTNEGRDKGKKMRFEKEKTWALSKRLGTWNKNNEKNYNNNQHGIYQQYQRPLSKREQRIADERSNDIELARIIEERARPRFDGTL